MTDRYFPQLLLPQIGKKGQQKLANSKLVIIGCGALGTVLSNHLARAGVGHLRIIDRDIIELSNLQRQLLFDEQDVGQPKAATAVIKLKKINSTITLEAEVADLTATNIETLISGFDLILDATDNFKTRLLINDVSVKHSIPWIYTGVLETSGMTMAMTGKGPCLACLLPALPDSGELDTCQSVGILNTIPSIMASIQATMAIKYLLTGIMDSQLIRFDVWNMIYDSFPIETKEKCLCCQQKVFNYLDAADEPYISHLCQNAVQIHRGSLKNPDLLKIGQRLQPLYNVHYNDAVLNLSVENKQIIVFSDGRVIVKGTGDFGAARSLIAKYIGE